MKHRKQQIKPGEVEYKQTSGTAWSHSYLNQKPWHPLSYPNQRRKWIAEQTHARHENKKTEVAKEFAQEQEFFQQASMLSKKQKEKVEAMRAVSFMYMRPPGYNAESARAAEIADERKKLGLLPDPQASSTQPDTAPDEQGKAESKKGRVKDVFGMSLATEDEFAVLKNAPRFDTGAPGRVKPFAVEIRNVKCARCGAFGHQSGDRDCPMRDVVMPSEEARLARDDPLNIIIAQTGGEPLKWELKQLPGGLSPARGGFRPDDPNQQIIPTDIFDEYGGFLAGSEVPDVLAMISSERKKKRERHPEGKRHMKRDKKRKVNLSDSEVSTDEGRHAKKRIRETDGARDDDRGFSCKSKVRNDRGWHAKERDRETDMGRDDERALSSKSKVCLSDSEMSSDGDRRHRHAKKRTLETDSARDGDKTFSSKRKRNGSLVGSDFYGTGRESKDLRDVRDKSRKKKKRKEKRETSTADSDSSCREYVRSRRSKRNDSHAPKSRTYKRESKDLGDVRDKKGREKEGKEKRETSDSDSSRSLLEDVRRRSSKRNDSDVPKSRNYDRESDDSRDVGNKNRREKKGNEKRESSDSDSSSSLREDVRSRSSKHHASKSRTYDRESNDLRDVRDKAKREKKGKEKRESSDSGSSGSLREDDRNRSQVRNASHALKSRTYDKDSGQSRHLKSDGVLRRTSSKLEDHAGRRLKVRTEKLDCSEDAEAPTLEHSDPHHWREKDRQKQRATRQVVADPKEYGPAIINQRVDEHDRWDGGGNSGDPPRDSHTNRGRNMEHVRDRTIR